MSEITVDGQLVTGMTVDGEEVDIITIDGCVIMFSVTEKTSWFYISGGSGTRSLNIPGIFMSGRIRFRGSSRVTSTAARQNDYSGIGSSSGSPGSWTEGWRTVPTVPSPAYGCSHSSPTNCSGTLRATGSSGSQAEGYAYGYGPRSGNVSWTHTGPNIPWQSSLGFMGRSTTGNVSFAARCRIAYGRS